MKKMKIAALLLALLVATLSACKGGGKGETAKPEKGGRAALSYAVDAMQIEAKKVDYVVNAPGTIEAFERVQVTARVAGVVDRVAFAEGQEVKKGDTLVVIDSERYYLAVKSAQAAVEKAEAGVRDAEAMVARRETASEKTPGLIPGEELETYRTKSLTAKADRDVAAQALKTAQLNLRDSSVRAPIEGVIQTRTVETGQYVQQGYVMATLLRSDPLLLRFQIEPRAAPRIKPGMTAKFTMRETLRTFNARITLVAASADPETHMVPVTGEVVDEEHKYWLRPGSFCDVALTLPAQRDAPMIPRIAARATDHGYVAFVVDGDTAHEHVLSLGMSTKDGWIEVRSGLAAGDLLVVRGAEALTDGAKVKVSRVTPDSINTGADADTRVPGPQGGDAPAGDSDGAAAEPSANPSASPSADAGQRGRSGGPKSGAPGRAKGTP